MSLKRLPFKPAGALLAPGAGSGRDHSTLSAIDSAFEARGVPVLRIDFPYRLAGRRAPDRPAVLIESIREAANGLADKLNVGTERLILGGRSMGGRICSLSATLGVPCAGLLLVSYPLHPPGRPDRSRTDHFSQIDVPCLFISGDRDAFGSPSEMEAATASITGPVDHVWIAGGDHSLRNRDAEVADTAASWLPDLQPVG